LVTAVRYRKREFQERGVYADLNRLEDLVRAKARTSHGSMNSSPPNTSAQRALDAGEE